MHNSGLRQIGIYAGAFDPVHEGHVAFAKQAMAEAGLDKVYFLVEPRPRHKQGVKAHEHRTAMVDLAIADQPRMGQIVLDQQRFTVHETWPILQTRFAGVELCMLTGSDVFKRLASWPRIDELVTSAQFLVGLRKNDPGAEMAGHMAMLAGTKAIDIRYRSFQSPHAEYSSRSIRADLRKGRLPAGISPAVAAYIAEQKLYSATDIAAE